MKGGLGRSSSNTRHGCSPKPNFDFSHPHPPGGSCTRRLHKALHTACTGVAQVLHTAHVILHTARLKEVFVPAMWISADSPRREYVFPRRTSVARRQRTVLFCPPFRNGDLLLRTNSPLLRGRKFPSGLFSRGVTGVLLVYTWSVTPF
jgi:hypothetical protein